MYPFARASSILSGVAEFWSSYKRDQGGCGTFLDLCFLCFFSLFLLALGSPIEDATRLGTRPGRDCAALGLACALKEQN
jgi:hypothetical protein